jgi:hypothetical protein
MTLFQIQTGTKIKGRCDQISYYLADEVSVMVAQNVVWQGIATDQFFVFHGDQRRRLVIILATDVKALLNRGVWLKDIPCELAN